MKPSVSFAAKRMIATLRWAFFILLLIPFFVESAKYAMGVKRVVVVEGASQMVEVIPDENVR